MSDSRLYAAPDAYVHFINTHTDMKKNDGHIGTLIERYFDGTTTASEERELARYFRQAGDNIPDEWVPIRAMMAYADEERAAVDAPDTTGVRTARTAVMRRRRLIPAVAALLAAACVAGVLLLTGTHGGSDGYAVIDGKVYTSRQVVEREAVEALRMVSADDSDPYSALDMMTY